MNIGTIVEAGKLKVVLKSGRRLGGKVLGEVEEYFASLLEPGDSFLFAGQLLEFRGIRDMRLEVGLATRASEPKVPSYVGGNMPLSTYLAEEVRYLLADRSSWHWVGKDAEIWLEHQARVSLLPSPDEVLVETFPRQGRWYLAFYPFGGRSAHQSLGMLLTREMEHRGLKPMGFVASDYGVAVWSLEEVIHPETLLNEALLGEGYEEWLAESVLLKRSFGRVAVVSGLTERRMPGLEKTGRQVTFSTDLIYDVLRRHEPNHILLQINRLEAERTLVDTPRLSLLLNSMAGKLRHIRLPRISPLSIPLVLEIGREAVQGSAADALMQDLSREEQAELLLKEATEG
jgi:ATP-dependent Lhr-like helicase